jgi:alpha-beta hydrolase superfamily lysophospholipase
MSMTRRSLLWLALLLAAALALGLLAIGHWATRVPPGIARPLPADFAAHQIALRDAEGRRIAATALPGRAGAGAVLLLHQRRTSQLAMKRRAQAFQEQGVAVLLIDHLGHGHSEGSRRGFGYQERLGVLAAWDWMQSHWPAERKAVLGVSLGAAAWVLAEPDPKPVAVVLEMMYASLDETLADRLRARLGEPAGLLAPLLGWQSRIWTGAGSDANRPIDGIARLGAPLLLVAGDADLQVTTAQSRRLFDAAQQPKSFWLLAGAGHKDFQAYDPAAYRERVIGFLIQHLQPESDR